MPRAGPAPPRGQPGDNRWISSTRRGDQQERDGDGMIIDGMMHLEVSGACWDGLVDEVIELYDSAGIDKGVIVTTWTPSREPTPDRSYNRETRPWTEATWEPTDTDSRASN
jgi:hypothetical protein